MRTKNCSLFRLMGILVLACGFPTAEGQTVWQGPDGGSFSDDGNWSLGEPGTGDTGIHQTNTEIIFDESSSWNSPYDFDFYQAQTTTTEFTLGEASGGTANGLRLVDGLADRLSDVNDSVINVGSLDAFWVGAGILDQQTDTEADAKGYKWIVIGDDDPEAVDPALAGVTGTTGPGEWLAQAAVLSFGYEVGIVIEIGFGDALTTSGTIDSGVTSAISSPGDSTWTLQAVKMKAKKCKNLDYWYINHDAGPSEATKIEATEYFEARVLVFVGNTNVGGNGAPDLLEVTFDPDVTPSSGLRVLQHMILRGTNPTVDDGATVRAGEMLVKRQNALDDPAQVLIKDASKLHVHWEGLNEDQTVHPAFEEGASLVYGAKHPEFDEQDIWLTGFRNYFEVFTKEGGNPGDLTFDSDSFFRPEGSPIISSDDPGPYTPRSHDLLHNMTNSHFWIESEVSEVPARSWHTGDVDLWFHAFEHDVELEYEVITEDGCNLWFADVPEPRCAKYWRNLIVQGPDPLILIDGHNNHICADDEGDNALYILEDIRLDDYGVGGVLDVNDMSVYYGGEIVDAGGEIEGSPAPAQLQKTIYGDFNADCEVDSADVTILSDYLGQVSSRCDWPIADFDGDCDVDGDELSEVIDRATTLQNPHPECDDEEIQLVCLDGGFLESFGGGGQQEQQQYAPPARGQVERFTDSLTAYLTTRDPADQQEEDETRAAVASLATYARNFLPTTDRESLAETLESANYASSTAEELGLGFARSLSD